MFHQHWLETRASPILCGCVQELMCKSGIDVGKCIKLLMMYRDIYRDRVGRWENAQCYINNSNILKTIFKCLSTGFQSWNFTANRNPIRICRQLILGFCLTLRRSKWEAQPVLFSLTHFWSMLPINQMS